MAAWTDVEEVVTHWLTDAGMDVWTDLAELELERDELRRRDCECGCCRKIACVVGFELQEMFETAATGLLPLLRLEATNRSARARRQRGA